MSHSRILVADNHENVREVMSSLLELLDIEAIPCSGGDEVLQRLDAEEFDAVISDVVMPELGGMEKVVKLKEKRPRLPVIMISSYATEALEQEAKSLGAVGLVAKPFKIDAITRLLKTAGIDFVLPS